MITDFEKEVKEAFINAKLGERVHEIADVDLHFVLPLAVFVRYEAFIHSVTDGDFQVSAGYNLVLLYTDANDAKRVGTVMFGHDLDGLIAAWSNVLDDIAADPDPVSQLTKFKGAHAYFRGAMCVKPDVIDPCASANPLTKARSTMKTTLWGRMLGRA